MIPRDASLALLTDLYQLTMAYGYWKHRRHDYESVFHLTFRKCPFGGAYALACGLHSAIEYLSRLTFAPDDLAYLATLKDSRREPLFEPAFLEFLGVSKFTCDVDAIPEGTAVFPHEPLVRVQGPLWQAQLVETALLTLVNFETLIATKASRVRLAAGDDSVLEFGLRRAQGPDGGVSASRAAIVGGCNATSNVLAAKLFNLPTSGTHAHSWVMSYPTEQEAFEAYAEALPGNAVFLVDTYDTIEGVKRAVAVGRKLRERGASLVGVRLDSGDLAALSKAARTILDEGGFPEAKVVASGDLDERLILELKAQGARIDVWGVGTKLAVAYDQPALGGIYKLGAIRAPGEEWEYKLKKSELLVKVSNPGVQQVRRFVRDGRALGDVIYHTGHPFNPRARAIDVRSAHEDWREPDPLAASHDLLKPILRGGRLVYDAPPIEAIRAHAREQLAALGPRVTAFESPVDYPVGLDESLFELKKSLLAAIPKSG